MAARNCVAVDIQIIWRKAHALTGLNGRVGIQNNAVRESPCLSDHLGFPSRLPLRYCQRAIVLAAVKMLWGGSEGTYPSLH